MPTLDPHIFETIMLFCFGSSWPFAIAKTIRTKTVRGKSIVFIALVLLGYLCGIISKLVGNFDHVIWLYVLNGSMVSTELLLYFRYHWFRDRRILPSVKPEWHNMNRGKRSLGLNKTAV